MKRLKGLIEGRKPLCDLASRRNALVFRASVHKPRVTGSNPVAAIFRTLGIHAGSRARRRADRRGRRVGNLSSECQAAPAATRKEVFRTSPCTSVDPRCSRGHRGLRSEEHRGSGPVVGFSQIGAESAWRTAETESIRGEAERRGSRSSSPTPRAGRRTRSRPCARSSRRGVDAIILAPVVETGWEPVLREAKQAKIPVILVDRGVNVTDESLYATLIASDFVAEGRMAGEWLAKKTGGKAKIVELQGTPGAAPAIDRKKGFDEAIAAAPGDEDHREPDRRLHARRRARKSWRRSSRREGRQHRRRLRAQRRHGARRDPGDRGSRQEAGHGRHRRLDRRRARRVRGDGRGQAELHRRVQPAARPERVRRRREGPRAGEPVPKRIVVEDRVFEQEQARRSCRTGSTEVALAVALS